MKTIKTSSALCLLGLLLLCSSWSWSAGPQGDPLPSWQDGAVKQAITKFVAQVTDKAGPKFVPPRERIAVFDNDGTLWAEQPIYFQFLFAFDRIKALAPAHPEWKDQQPFKALLAGDRKHLMKMSPKEIGRVVAATHSGLTTDQFRQAARDWLARAKHPRFKRLYTELAYKPMLELLAYLRAQGFKTFIVSGGEVLFMRAFTEQVYGVVPEQVIGTSLLGRFEMRGKQPVIAIQPKLGSYDDKGGKPVNIDLHIGRRPILACGNSDGDLQMLQYTDYGKRPRLMMLIHHDDAKREYAYDRKSKIGRLDKALDEAKQRGWTVVSMKNDFARVFSFETPGQ